MDAAIAGVADVVGVYSCLAVNIAGAANASSYIVPFGGEITQLMFLHEHNITS